ncbi:MAG: DUF2939 domain-containing protein [Selenomonadaceae bacterium]|nr:DUF2939 domain-containing protein [Selenomonadaceae bacterium]
MQSNKKWIIAFLVFALLILGGIGGYIYYIRTPQYSLKLIQEAVQEHNWQKFSRHVDVKSVTESAFDDLIAAATEKDKSMDDDTKNLAAGFAQMLKPVFVNAFEEGIKKYVETGNLNEQQKQEPAKDASEDMKNQAANNWIKNSRAGESKFTGIKGTVKEGSVATVILGLRDEKLKADYEIKLFMNQLEDGTWRLTKISNIKEFFKSVETAKNKEVDRLNKPIRAELDKAVQIGEMTASVRQEDPFGFSQRLILKADYKVTSEKPLASFSGEITMTSPTDKTKTMRFDYELEETGDNKLSLSKELNPFISEEKEIAKQNAKGYTFETVVTGVKYKDGTSVELLTELPE